MAQQLEHATRVGAMPLQPGVKVAVLLATYNGAWALAAQLHSYTSQTHPPALVLVSDDGSSDDTRAIVEAFAQAHPAIALRFVDGPRKGAAQNFLSLLRQVPDWIDCAALSDQDDVWLPEKLEAGVSALTTDPDPGQSLLYCGRSWECDDQLEHLTLSRGIKRPASFRHALVQNVAGGNTMMLNRAALDLCRDAAYEARKIVVHDWWIYQMVTGAGGRVLFDDRPWILYRQHEGNLIGANRGVAAKKKRLKMLVSGRFRRWNTVNIRALGASAHRFTPENRATLTLFAQDRNGALWRRVSVIWRAGLYRQGLSGTLSLYLAAILRRL